LALPNKATFAVSVEKQQAKNCSIYEMREIWSRKWEEETVNLFVNAQTLLRAARSSFSEIGK
jgi:hypothetical protein